MRFEDRTQDLPARLRTVQIVALAGFGSRHAAPAARAIYDVYFEKPPRPAEMPEQIAQVPES